MTTWTWTIGLLHATDSGVVRAIDWTLTGSRGDKAASRSGRCWLNAPGEAFIPIDAVTDAHAIGWIEGRIAVDGVQAGILQDLDPLDYAALYAVEPKPEPEPAPAPEAPAIVVPDALAGLVLPDETAGETKARLAGRWVELTHLLQMGLATAEQASEHTLLSAHQSWLQS